MKKNLTIIMALLVGSSTVFAQQFPFLEGYNINPFSLSPAYAGYENANYLFSDYRTDWSGVEGRPTTLQLSYSIKATERMGIGGRFIYDKSDIFKHTLILGSYSYQVEVIDSHFLTFAISAGVYRNSIDVGKYFNDPNYVNDRVLTNDLEKSKLKFASDLSALYIHGPIETGLVFSNIMFGSAKYDNTLLVYKPLKNYLIHASYSLDVNELFSVKPVVIFMGGQNSPVSLEFAPQVKYKEKCWGTLSFRTGGVWGLGLGAEIIDGVKLNYSYNMCSGLAMSIYGGHEISLGIRLVDLPMISGTRKTN